MRVHHRVTFFKPIKFKKGFNQALNRNKVEPSDKKKYYPAIT